MSEWFRPHHMLSLRLGENRDDNPTRLYSKGNWERGRLKIQSSPASFGRRGSPDATTMRPSGESPVSFLKYRPSHDLCLLKNFQWFPIACRTIFKFLSVTFQSGLFTPDPISLSSTSPHGPGAAAGAAILSDLRTCNLVPYLSLWFCFHRSSHSVWVW